MGMFSFVTNRTLPSKSGKGDAGRVRAFVKSGGTLLEGDFTCPECGSSGKISQQFRRPLSIKCQSCGVVSGLPRLKDEMKRDKKKGLA